MATKTTKTTKTAAKTTRAAASTTRKAPAKSATKTTTKSPARKAAPARTSAAAEARISADEYRPISMWGYFGWEIVYAIPLIGWIICIGQAFCAENRNLRNFARSQFCWLIIWLIGVCVMAGLGVFTSLFAMFGLI